MEIKKLETDDYVVITEELIEPGDYYINTDTSNRYANKKIFRAMPRSLKDYYGGKGFKEPDYFKKWMRKIIASTVSLKGVNTITVEEMELLIKNLNKMENLQFENFYYGTDEFGTYRKIYYKDKEQILYTEEQVREAIRMTRREIGYGSNYEFREDVIIQSLKPKKD